MFIIQQTKDYRHYHGMRPLRVSDYYYTDLYETEERAQEHAKLQNQWAAENYRYAPKPAVEVVPAPKVCQARILRDERGQLKPPVWGFGDSDYNVVHVDPDNPKLLRYVDHVKDRWVSIKPGRYLKQFFLDLSEKQVAFYAEWFTKGQVPLVEMNTTLHVATTADEMVHVYKNGPSSCMSHDGYTYAHPHHPVEVYAAGDFELAYLTDDDDKIVARCLTIPSRNIFCRIYPNTGSWREDGFLTEHHAQTAVEILQRAMIEKGYESAYSVRTDRLTNLRLARIANPHGFIMPYLDHVSYVRDEGDHFMIDNDRITYSAGSTCGAIQVSWGTCDCCDTTTPGVTLDQMTRVKYDFYCDECVETETTLLPSGERIPVQELEVA